MSSAEGPTFTLTVPHGTIYKVHATNGITAVGTGETTGDMRSIRSDHTATLLSNGMVLVVGGDNEGAKPLASAEIYEPTVTKKSDISASGQSAHPTAPATK